MNDQRSRSYRIWSGVVGFGAYGLLLAIDFLTESETRSVGTSTAKVWPEAWVRRASTASAQSRSLHRTAR